MIIVIEKPNAARVIAPIARKLFPTEPITFLCSLPYTNIRFVYPRGLSWKDYPVVSSPVYSLAPWDSFRPMSLGPDGQLSNISMDDTAFLAADSIMFASDPDHTGAVTFDILTEHFFGTEISKFFPAIRLESFNEEQIETAFSEVGEFAIMFRAAIDYGRAKKYFDWNWNVNALSIFGTALRSAGVSASAPPLSKYGLQLLYSIRDELPMREGDLFSKMSKWKGSGKYTPSIYTQLGSPASMSQIIINLKAAELLEYNEHEKTVQISAKGRVFLALLHPNCFDPDLPFRINKWGKDGITKSQPSIDRYIRTVFGKQKSFGARNRTRTGTPKAADFKSAVST